jgi:excisionase family DNA binding protein
MDTLLTVPEVADRLQVQPATVNGWIRGGKLRAIRVGGSRTGYRVTEADLQQWLDGNATQPATPVER